MVKNQGLLFMLQTAWSKPFFLVVVIAWFLPNRPSRKGMHPVLRWTARLMEFQNLFVAMENSTKQVRSNRGRDWTAADHRDEWIRRRCVNFCRPMPLYAITWNNLIFGGVYVGLLWSIKEKWIFENYYPGEIQMDLWGGTSFVVLFLFTTYTERCLTRYNKFYDAVTSFMGNARDMLIAVSAESNGKQIGLIYDMYRYVVTVWILNFTGLSAAYSYEFYDHFVDHYHLLTPEENKKLRCANDTMFGWFGCNWMVARLKLAKERGELSEEGYARCITYPIKIRYDSTILFTMLAWPAPRSFRHSIKLLLSFFLLMTTITVGVLQEFGEPWSYLEVIYNGALLQVLVIILGVCEGADKPFGEAPQHFPLLVWTENFMEELRVGFLTEIFEYEQGFKDKPPPLIAARDSKPMFDRTKSCIFGIKPRALVSTSDEDYKSEFDA